MVTIHDFYFSYRRRPVFTGLNLDLRPGYIYGLLGKNGTGKSTLLRNIAGFLFPQRGRIEVLGFTPGKRQPAFLQKVFLLPEDLHLPAITMDEWIRHNAPFYPSFSRQQFNRYIADFEVPVEGRLDEMSYGQQKKALISWALAINAPAGWNGLAFAAGHFDFSERGGAGSHVNHNGRLFLAGEGDGDGVGAQHAFHAPEGRDQAGGVGHGPADQVAFQRLENIVAGDAEMICIAHTDPAGAGFVRHVHGDAIRLRADNEPEAVVAIDGGGTQRRSHRGDSGFRIDVAFAEHSKIAIEPGDAMRINAAQIRGGQHIGSLRGVFLGHAKVEKDARTEFAQRVNVKNLGFQFGQVSPYGFRIRRLAELADFNSFCAQKP